MSTTFVVLILFLLYFCDFIAYIGLIASYMVDYLLTAKAL